MKLHKVTCFTSFNLKEKFDKNWKSMTRFEKNGKSLTRFEKNRKKSDKIEKSGKKTMSKSHKV